MGKNEKGPVEGQLADLVQDHVAAPGQLTGTQVRRLAEVTKEGPGLRKGPSLETDPSPVAGPGLRTGPSLGTVLNRSLDLVLNPGMINLKQKTSQFENYEKPFLSHYGKNKTNFYN